MSKPMIVFGLEWECALGRDGAARAPLERSTAWERLVEAVCDLSPWLMNSNGGGLFTPGFRFYCDAGGHPEVASAEVASPEQFLELKRAIFTLLDKVVRRVQRQISGLVFLVNNHDYLDDGAFWGCHESYALRGPPDRLAAGMVPFLATRPLLAGSGRIDACGRVLASPRALAIRQTTGGGTQSDRALFSTARDESLMQRGRFTHRLHLICGDAVRCELSDYLKVATTALVLLWLQEEPHGADDLTVPDPLLLLRETNLLWEPPGRLHISRAALEIQRAYCEKVARFVEHHPELPAWCGRAVGIWQQTLHTLAREPLELADRLDCFVKLALYDATLRQLGRNWSEVADVRWLYQTLALVDLSYHRLGDGDLFTQLCHKGQVRPLDHSGAACAAEGLTPAQVASRLPTRAAARARAIVEHSGRSDVRCYWTRVERLSPPGQLDLADPLRTELPDWSPANAQ